VNEHVNVFTIETVLNNRMYGEQLDFLAKPEERWTAFDRGKFQAMKWTLSRLPGPAKRKILHNVPAPYGVIAVNAGRTEEVHELTVQRCFDQYMVPVSGQADIVIFGIPFISPYNVH